MITPLQTDSAWRELQREIGGRWSGRHVLLGPDVDPSVGGMVGAGFVTVAGLVIALAHRGSGHDSGAER